MRSVDWSERCRYRPADTLALPVAIGHRVLEMDAGIHSREAVLAGGRREPFEVSRHSRQRETRCAKAHVVAIEFYQHLGCRRNEALRRRADGALGRGKYVDQHVGQCQPPTSAVSASRVFRTS